MAGRYVAAIDLGGTFFRTAVVDHSGRIIERRREPTHGEEGASAIVRRIAESLADVVANVDRSGIIALGASVPAGVDRQTGHIFPPNLPAVIGMDMRAELEAAFGVATVVENDANCGALGETRFGAGRGHDSVVYITVSTGVGGGIVIGGELLRGEHGLAGEIGHTYCAPEGPRCACGNQGCLEAVASGTSLGRIARLRIAAGEASYLTGMAGGDIEAVTGAMVGDAAQRGDPLALDVVRNAGEALGRAIVSVIHLIDPNRLILGGGVMELGDLILGPVNEAVATDAFEPFRGRCEVVPAELGDDACLIGAAALAFDQFG